MSGSFFFFFLMFLNLVYGFLIKILIKNINMFVSQVYIVYVLLTKWRIKVRKLSVSANDTTSNNVL